MLTTFNNLLARLVCKDYRSNGLTSVREDIYSPTSNLESLRLLVSFAQSWNLCIYGADVSTAFLYSPLDSVEIISLPTTTVGANGDGLYVQLQKALYGLRRAPLAWYETLKGALVELGLQSTSEPTLFRCMSSFVVPPTFDYHSSNKSSRLPACMFSSAY